MNCGFISKDVVMVEQKALYTHYQVSRENVLLLCLLILNTFYPSYFYSSYVIFMDRLGEALE